MTWLLSVTVEIRFGWSMPLEKLGARLARMTWTLENSFVKFMAEIIDFPSGDKKTVEIDQRFLCCSCGGQAFFISESRESVCIMCGEIVDLFKLFEELYFD